MAMFSAYVNLPEGMARSIDPKTRMTNRRNHLWPFLEKPNFVKSAAKIQFVTSRSYVVDIYNMGMGQNPVPL